MFFVHLGNAHTQIVGPRDFPFTFFHGLPPSPFSWPATRPEISNRADFAVAPFDLNQAIAYSGNCRPSALRSCLDGCAGTAAKYLSNSVKLHLTTPSSSASAAQKGVHENSEKNRTAGRGGSRRRSHA